MAGKRRRRSVALTPGERDAGLRVAFLKHYGDDPDFGRELTTLYAERAESARPLPFDPAEWWIGAASDRADVRELWGVTPAVAAYVGAVRALAGRYGLPRLVAPDDWLWDRLTVGEWLIHAWCSWRATAAAIGRTVGPVWFSHGYGLAEAQADLLEGAFDPRRELYGDARTRLGWRHRTDLEATAEAAERAGYVFLDGAPELRRDLAWLYRHVARRETFVAIANTDLGDRDEGPETVRQAVRRMSQRVMHPGV